MPRAVRQARIFRSQPGFSTRKRRRNLESPTFQSRSAIRGCCRASHSTARRSRVLFSISRYSCPPWWHSAARNYSTSIMISSFRSRRGGTSIGKNGADKKVLAKIPLRRCLQITIRGSDDANIGADRLPSPTRSNSRSCSTLSSATWVSGRVRRLHPEDGPAISHSKRPSRRCTAPVKAPSHGEQLEAIRSRGIAAHSR